MIDLRAKFTPRNLSTEFIGEAQTDPAAERKVLKGEIQLVLISPESIVNVTRYRNMLLSQVYKEKLVGLVIDEAHCVKTWGDEFRTAFAHITKFVTEWCQCNGPNSHCYYNDLPCSV